MRSADGKHWHEVLVNRWRIAGVIALEDGFLSVFNEHFQTSYDGRNWETQAAAKIQARDSVGSGFPRRWATGNGIVVLAGDYEEAGGKPRAGWIGSTRNGTTAMTLEKQSTEVRGLAFGNGCFVACTKDGNVVVSTNGIHFKPAASTGDQHDGDCGRFHNGMFYLSGHKVTQISEDGENWSRLENPPQIPRALSPSGVALDFDWGGLALAPDGKTFQKASAPIDPTGICAVAYGVPLDVSGK